MTGPGREGRDPVIRIQTRPGAGPVLAPLSLVETGAADRIAAASAAVSAGFSGGEIVLGATDDGAVAELARELDRRGGGVLAMPGPEVPFAVFERLAALTRFTIGRAVGDPSPFTALGVLSAVRGAIGPLAGRRVAVLGAGRVGRRLAALLADADAEVLVADRRLQRAEAAAEAANGRAVAPDELIRAECDVLSPNARGVVVDAAAARRLGAGLVAGSQTGSFGPEVEEILRARGIVAVPGEIAGSGWLLALAAEIRPGGYREDAARALVTGIEEKVRCWLSKRSG